MLIAARMTALVCMTAISGYVTAGLKLSDAVYNEELQAGYFNVVAVRTEDVEKDFSKEIYSIIHSDSFRSVIENPDGQYVAFGRPVDYLK